MAASFCEQTVLNSPYWAPLFHHALDANGQPLDRAPVERRRSEIITPAPMPRMQTRRNRRGLFQFNERDDRSRGEHQR